MFPFRVQPRLRRKAKKKMTELLPLKECPFTLNDRYHNDSEYLVTNEQYISILDFVFK